MDFKTEVTLGVFSLYQQKFNTAVMGSKLDLKTCEDLIMANDIIRASATGLADYLEKRREELRNG